MFKGAALHAFVYLQVHGVAFGLNPHIPHVTISEEQQAFSCDVIIFKEVRVALHVVCTDPWNTESAPTNQFFYYHLWTIVDGEGGGHIPVPKTCCIQKYWNTEAAMPSIE